MVQPHRNMNRKMSLDSRVKVRCDVHTPCMYVSTLPEHVQVGLFLSLFRIRLLCNQMIWCVLSWLSAKMSVRCVRLKLNGFSSNMIVVLSWLPAKRNVMNVVFELNGFLCKLMMKLMMRNNDSYKKYVKVKYYKLK